MIGLSLNQLKPANLCLTCLLVLFSYPALQAETDRTVKRKEQQPVANPEHIEIKSEIPGRKKSIVKNPQLSHFMMHIQVTLGDGRVLEGRLPVDAPKRFTIQHHIDGITYHKEIKISELKGIKIKSWSGHVVGERKEGKVYEFRPAEFEILLPEGSFHSVPTAALAFLNQFPVYNQNGRVYLFSFWRDLQRADGSWFTGMKGRARTRRICHADVVQKIMIQSVQRAPKPAIQKKNARAKK